MTATRPDSYYDVHIFVCTFVRPGESARRCCGASDAERLLTYLRTKAKEIGIAGLRVNAAGCLSPECCNIGPVLVIYPEGIWYKYQTEADLDEIVAEHLLQRKPVERLRLKPNPPPMQAPRPEPRTDDAAISSDAMIFDIEMASDQRPR